MMDKWVFFHIAVGLLILVGSGWAILTGLVIDALDWIAVILAIIMAILNLLYPFAKRIVEYTEKKKKEHLEKEVDEWVDE